VTTIFSREALRCADRLVRKAIWNGTQCTWLARPIRSGDDAHRVDDIFGSVYEGTAGIAVFLAECAIRFSREELRDCALGAARRGIAWAESAEAPVAGFYSGTPGVAWACARVGQLLETDEFEPAVTRLLRSALHVSSKDRMLDVIGGTAGTLLSVINSGRLTSNPDLEPFLLTAGDHLVKQARQRVCGWSWGCGGLARMRDLTGFAHGTSGIGFALNVLAEVTGETTYAFAAVMAARYEDRWFDQGRANWPDFRDNALGSVLASEGPGAVAKLVEGRGRDYQRRPTFMSAWCHGAPGILLARCFGSASDPRAEEGRLLLALRECLAVTREQMANWSLCHGLAGNLEAIHDVARHWGEPALVAAVRDEWATAISARSDASAEWASGAPHGAHVPGLMLGEAGVGYACLRIDDPTVPSVLLCGIPTDGRPRGEPARMVPVESKARDWRRETVRYLQALLPETMNGITNKAPARVDAFIDGLGDVTHLTVKALSAQLESVCDDQRFTPDNAFAQLAERELQRVALEDGPLDEGQYALWLMCRGSDVISLGHPAAMVMKAPTLLQHVRLGLPGGSRAAAAAAPAQWAIVSLDGSVRLVGISAGAGIVLDALANGPVGAVALLRNVVDHLEEADERAEASVKVLVEAMERAGLVRVMESRRNRERVDEQHGRLREAKADAT
jgi:hypothetical protein